MPAKATIRTLPLALAAASLVWVLATGSLMAMRLAEHYRQSGRELYMFQPVNDRSFSYAGRPVSIRDQTDEHGNDIVAVGYGDESLRLRVPITPGHADLPGLTRHDEWLRVYRFAPRRGKTVQEVERAIREGMITDRLVIATLTPRPGTDPQTYGRVWRRDALFDFYELLPDGRIDHRRLRQPESERALKRRQDQARERGQPIPQRRQDELVPGFWEHEVASLLLYARGAPTAIPGSPSPNLGPAGGPVGAMGWTLPATSVGILVLLLSLAIGLAPSRERVARRTSPPSP